MADASFQIDQVAPGTVDLSRRDIIPNSLGGSVSLVAQNAGHTYEWVVAQPPGSSVPLVNPTSQTCTIAAEKRGGYLVKLTTDKGTPAEDIKILYFGIAMAASGLPLPAVDRKSVV